MVRNLAFHPLYLKSTHKYSHHSHCINNVIFIFASQPVSQPERQRVILGKANFEIAKKEEKTLKPTRNGNKVLCMFKAQTNTHKNIKYIFILFFGSFWIVCLFVCLFQPGERKTYIHEHKLIIFLNCVPPILTNKKKIINFFPTRKNQCFNFWISLFWHPYFMSQFKTKLVFNGKVLKLNDLSVKIKLWQFHEVLEIP